MDEIWEGMTLLRVFFFGMILNIDRLNKSDKTVIKLKQVNLIVKNQIHTATTLTIKKKEVKGMKGGLIQEIYEHHIGLYILSLGQSRRGRKYYKQILNSF